MGNDLLNQSLVIELESPDVKKTYRKNVWHDFSKSAVYEHPVWNHPIL
jgi:hypothetical protein